MTWRDKRLESGSRGWKEPPPWWIRSEVNGHRKPHRTASGLKRLRAKMTPLTSFQRTFLVAVKGSLRRASTPLTEDFQVTNRSSHSIDIKEGKKGYVETMIYLDNSNQRWLLSNRIRLLKRKRAVNKYIEQVDRDRWSHARMYGLHPLPTKAYRKVVYGLPRHIHRDCKKTRIWPVKPWKSWCIYSVSWILRTLSNKHR